jgi:hypothetical protein
MRRNQRRRIAFITSALLASGVATASDEIEIHDAWSRATPPGHPTGAVYFELVNDSRLGDTLVGVSTSRAPRSELHQTIEEGGNSRMVHTPRVDIPAESEVIFEPGGRHVMLLDLEDALVEGESFQIYLQLEDGGEVPVEVGVLAPTAMGSGGHGHDDDNDHDHDHEHAEHDGHKH